jgi:uncharacterized protein (DUF1778 family)
MIPKTEFLTFRLSKEDKELIKDIASKKRLSASSYILTKVFKDINKR